MNAEAASRSPAAPDAVAPTGGDRPASPPPQPRPRWWPAVLSLLLCVAFAVLWFRTRSRSDYVVFFTPSGKVQGFGSDRGRLYAVFTNVSFGREQGLTAEAGSVKPEEFND